MPPKKKRGPNPRHHHDPGPGEDPLPLPQVAPASYWPPNARLFTPDEIKEERHKLNKKSRLTRIIEHPLDAVLEYPETTELSSEKIAHVFPIRPDAFRSPHLNIQYSLNFEGSIDDVSCKLLRDESGTPAQCYKISNTCR